MNQEADSERQFMTIDQVAGRLNTSDVQIRSLLRMGHLRGFQLGGRGVWRISQQDLESYIAEMYKQTAERISERDHDEAD